MFDKNNNNNNNKIKLPEPQYDSRTSVEEAILKRRSIRKYKNEPPLSLEEVSQLLWSAQGITKKWFRTVPSAGATYPLELYLVIGNNVKNLEPGIYHYSAKKHEIEKIFSGDIRKKLADAALGQYFILEAPVSIIFTAVYERTTRRYGERGVIYVHMEVGHAAQNVSLQCESLNLGTVVVGAFYNEEVKKVLKLDNNKEEPLYIMPIGRI